MKKEYTVKMIHGSGINIGDVVWHENDWTTVSNENSHWWTNVWRNKLQLVQIEKQ